MTYSCAHMGQTRAYGEYSSLTISLAEGGRRQEMKLNFPSVMLSCFQQFDAALMYMKLHIKVVINVSYIRIQNN